MRSVQIYFTRLCLLAAILMASSAGKLAAQSGSSVRFAVIGDYGKAGQPLLDVSNLIKSWNVDLIITTGDNNYPSGEAATIDQNIGQYFHNFIKPYTGSYGTGADVNRFFPALGNHDWKTSGAQPYLDYFTLPGNERYYDFVWGPVHFFCVDSDGHEPDGRTASSTQALWLQQGLAASSSVWNIVYMHHPPYSSAKTHGSTPDLQWPYAAWGATAVLAGHDHTYERIFRDGIVYFVNGVGGKSVRSFGTPIQGSQFRYSDDYGAMLVEATLDSLVFRFFNRNGTELDHYTVVKAPTGIEPPPPVAQAFRLEQNYPNPFNPVTTIPFQIQQAGEVELAIYNLLGERIVTLFRGKLEPGHYQFRWDGTTTVGRPASSGIYFYRLRHGNRVQNRKMLLIQ